MRASLRNTPRSSLAFEPSDSNHGPAFSPLPFSWPDTLALDAVATMSSSDIEEFIDLWDHYYPPFHKLGRYLRKVSPSSIKRNIDYARDNLPFHLYATLRSCTQQCAFDNFGMPHRIGLFVCNAEEIYALSHIAQQDFIDVYKRSIPFTQFMLQHLIGAGFGDSNEKLADAILNRDVSGYFRERIQEIAQQNDFKVPDDIEQTPPVHHSIVVTLQLRTAAQQEG